MQLRARDEDILKMESAFENKVRDLRRGEGEALNGRRRGQENTQKFQEFLDSSVSAARQRLLDVQKAHNRLIRRYTELQDKYLELKAATDEDWNGDEPLLSGGSDRDHRTSTQLMEDDFHASLDIGPGLGEDVQDELRKRNNGLWNTDVKSSSVPTNIVGRPESPMFRSPSRSPKDVRSPIGEGHAVLQRLGSGRGSTDSEGSINASGSSKLKLRSPSDARVFGRGMIYPIFTLEISLTNFFLRRRSAKLY
jgi:hypothetical protein